MVDVKVVGKNQKAICIFSTTNGSIKNIYFFLNEQKCKSEMIKYNVCVHQVT